MTEFEREQLASVVELVQDCPIPIGTAGSWLRVATSDIKGPRYDALKKCERLGLVKSEGCGDDFPYYEWKSTRLGRRYIRDWRFAQKTNLEDPRRNQLQMEMT